MQRLLANNTVIIDKKKKNLSILFSQLVAPTFVSLILLYHIRCRNRMYIFVMFCVFVYVWGFFWRKISSICWTWRRKKKRKRKKNNLSCFIWSIIRPNKKTFYRILQVFYELLKKKEAEKCRLRSCFFSFFLPLWLPFKEKKIPFWILLVFFFPLSYSFQVGKKMRFFPSSFFPTFFCSQAFNFFALSLTISINFYHSFSHYSIKNFCCFFPSLFPYICLCVTTLRGCKKGPGFKQTTVLQQCVFVLRRRKRPKR